MKTLSLIATIMLLITINSVRAENIFNYQIENRPTDSGWTILNGRTAYESTAVTINNRILHIDDRHTYDGAGVQYHKDWEIIDNTTNVAEFDAKVVSSSSFAGIYIGINIDTHHIAYTLYPDRVDGYILIGSSAKITSSYSFDTTSQVNTYKVLIEHGVAKLYINGDLVMEQIAGVGNYPLTRSSVVFGAGSSAATGEAYFYSVRAYTIPTNEALCNLKPITTTLFSPYDEISNNTPTYVWKAVENSSWYYLWVNDSSGNKIKHWYTAAQAGCSSGTGICSVTPSEVLRSGSAKWWIRTWNRIGYGAWSNAKNFSIQ